MRLPDKDGDWQVLISLLMLVCSIVLILIAEAKNRQAEATLKEISKTIKEVCR
ncbi:hypothetical protein Hydth_0900 [Hydrogenobacter thermophilus TK-6]|uniref:Uncharacterized protein n=1 Tax=Hydrogenobacter thermophilus (strain DSM 6534 / IAM 12695 / TK-6) TaxID=608538 RepID=D3DHQ8_HYDTT|nr:hypothetical protein [Hydrogenobacter thermophilus]ADO45296.1 hypothetical protein Hydth_0900 [Hydrogenobacter thermophilus TK-6]BAI69360.1 hypothetical protein HTH_0901 [Hydrogenobacter thermophilus TK-6]